MATVTPKNEAALEIDLKDPRLAAFLAWLMPGMGHMYQGRTGKGILFFVCIVGTFLYGLYIGDGRVVYASTADVFSRGFLERWQYLCQVGVGVPALPALVQRQRIRDGNEPLRLPIVGDHFMRPPYVAPPDDVHGQFSSPDQSDSARRVIHPNETAKWNYELGEYFEIGTVFTVIAGLLNLLAIFDAYGGPLVIPPEEEKPRGGKPPGPDSDEKS
jgi:TM2 domain-containing membrane protein YozV